MLEEQQREQGIIVTNEKTGEQTKIDPFEKVLLIKGIDNSILTSFRTLKKQNNIVSDTLKVIHNKFQPFVSKNQTFLNMERTHASRIPYPLTDDEDSLHMAAAKLYMRSNQSPVVTKESRSLSPHLKDANQENNPSSLQTGYNLVIGDVQEKMKQDIERKEANKNLHDEYNEGRKVSAAKKRLSTT